MISLLHLVLAGTILMLVWMGILWVVSLQISNAAILDVGWAGGLGILGALYALKGDGYAPRKWLIGGMVLFWSLRLTSHLLTDRIIGQSEDPRYHALRKRWKLPFGLLVFFEFQGLLDVVLSLPFVLMATNPAPVLSPIEWGGAAIWLVAVLGEAVADIQLKRFRADSRHRGEVCQAGLWNYSRHPNYFFEWLIWIGYFVAALPSPYGWTSVTSPLLILYFLLRVTGIPLTEAHSVETKGEKFAAYQRTTSAFVPWMKKTEVHG